MPKKSTFINVDLVFLWGIEIYSATTVPLTIHEARAALRQMQKEAEDPDKDLQGELEDAERERVMLPGGVGVGERVGAKAVVVAEAERVVAGAEVKVTRILQILLTVVIHQMMSLLKSMWQRNPFMMNQLSMTNMAVPMNQMLPVLMVMPMLLLLPLHWR